MLADLDPQLLNELRDHGEVLAWGAGAGLVIYVAQWLAQWWREWNWRRMTGNDPLAVRDFEFERRWGLVAEPDPDAPQDLHQIAGRMLSHAALILSMIVVGWALSRLAGLRMGDGVLLAGALGGLVGWYLDKAHRTPGRDIDESHFVPPPTLAEQVPREAVLGAVVAAAIVGVIFLFAWFL